MVFSIVRAAPATAANPCQASFSETEPVVNRTANPQPGACLRLSVKALGSLCSLMFALLTLTGCGNGLADVSGTVTLDGAPVEGSSDVYGTVTFQRDDGSGAPAVGIIQRAGRYEVSTGTQRGLAPGNYIVGVAVKKILPPAEPGGLTRPQRISAEKYARPEASGFRAEVKPGDNTFDFDLSSKKS
jgi:hypothetical protein